MHICKVNGDFIFKQWINEDFERMENKIKELENLGYKQTEEEMGYQDIFLHFVNKDGDEKIVTLMCV